MGISSLAVIVQVCRNINILSDYLQISGTVAIYIQIYGYVRSRPTHLLNVLSDAEFGRCTDRDWRPPDTVIQHFNSYSVALAHHRHLQLLHH